nr:transmembrane protein, putative [Ipomoea batatas]
MPVEELEALTNLRLVNFRPKSFSPHLQQVVALAEWLRRVPAKYMGFPRESSNLSGDLDGGGERVGMVGIEGMVVGILLLGSGILAAAGKGGRASLGAEGNVGRGKDGKGGSVVLTFGFGAEGKVGRGVFGKDGIGGSPVAVGNCGIDGIVGSGGAAGICNKRRAPTVVPMLERDNVMINERATTLLRAAAMIVVFLGFRERMNICCIV